MQVLPLMYKINAYNMKLGCNPDWRIVMAIYVCMYVSQVDHVSGFKIQSASNILFHIPRLEEVLWLFIRYVWECSAENKEFNIEESFTMLPIVVP